MRSLISILESVDSISTINEFEKFFLSKLHKPLDYKNFTLGIHTYNVYKLEAPHTSHGLKFYMNDNSYGKYIDVICYSTSFNSGIGVSLTSRAESGIENYCKKQGIKIRIIDDPSKGYTIMRVDVKSGIKPDDLLDLFRHVLNTIL